MNFTWLPSIAFILFLGLFMPANAQEEGVDIRQKIVTLKFERSPLGDIFRVLTNDYRVLIGFEESIYDRDHDDFDFETIPGRPYDSVRYFSDGRKVDIKASNVFLVKAHYISVDMENQPLSDALDVIVGQMKNYNWTISDGVVNIFPKRGRDRRFEKLLNLTLSDFEVPSNFPIGEIRIRLAGSPEIQKFLDDHAVSISRLRSDGAFANIILKKKIKASDLRLRDLLNRIASIKGGGWILKSNKMLKERHRYIELLL